MKVPKKTSNGNCVSVVGSHEAIGGWDVRKAVRLKRSGRDVWIGDVLVSRGDVFEYKYIAQSADGLAQAWQPGYNLVLEIPRDVVAVEVTDNWEGSERITTLLQEDPDIPEQTDPTPTKPAPLSPSPLQQQPMDQAEQEDSKVTPTPTSSRVKLPEGHTSELQDHEPVSNSSHALPTNFSRSQPLEERGEAQQQGLPSGSTEEALRDSRSATPMTKAELSKMTVKELKALCKDLNIPQKKLKADLIQALLDKQPSPT